jgi:Cu(I)/Ag(I) efflux system membrane protein CusA/SilA
MAKTPCKVIDNVKRRLEELKSGLPEGVSIKAVYDRSGLILRAVDNLKRTLIEESIIVAIVCIVFLFHFRSALVIIFTLPVSVLISFIIMHGQGINANIMSLGGIAIAIGAMVDGAIVMIENAHKHMEYHGGKKPHWELIADAAKEVGPALFFSFDYRREFSAGIHPRGPGRTVVPSPGLHQDLRHAGCRVSGHHHCTHSDGLPDPGKNQA